MATALIGSVIKASSLLGQFSYGEPVLGVSELARRMNVSKATAHRLAATLVDQGLLMQTPDNRYRLGLRLFELGQQAVLAHKIREIGHRHVESLRQASGETSHLAVLEGTDAVYLERIENPASFDQFGNFGQRVPAYASSSGKCLLAFAPHGVLEATVQKGFKRLASRTIASPAALFSALTQVRKQGYATSFEETYPGMASVAAPVRAPDGIAVAALSIAAFSSTFSDNRVRRLASLVTAAAKEMSADLRPRARR